jgi:hypothetical protein
MSSADMIYGTALGVWLLLVATGVSLGIAAVLGLHLWFGHNDRYRWAGLLCRVAAIFLAAVLSVDAIVATSANSDGLPHLLLSLVAVGAAIVTATLHRPVSVLAHSPNALWRTLSQCLLITACLASACWSGHRVRRVAYIEGDLGLFIDTPGTLVQATDQVLVTDRGQTLPVFRWDVADDVFEYYASLSEARLKDSHQACILRAPPDVRANCHGWVFAGGAHLLRGEDVARLLDDNGYQVVDRPQTNDLVIYRNDGGDIRHTGLVRGILDDGTVLIESKWGIDGRYLHRPEDQPYSPTFRYYRSPRNGHQVVLSALKVESGSDRPLASTSSSRPGL